MIEQGNTIKQLWILIYALEGGSRGIQHFYAADGGDAFAQVKAFIDQVETPTNVIMFHPAPNGHTIDGCILSGTQEFDAEGKPVLPKKFREPKEYQSTQE